MGNSGLRILTFHDSTTWTIHNGTQKTHAYTRPCIIPPLVCGTLCLFITDLSHNSQLHLLYPSPLSLLFHSLYFLFLAISSSVASSLFLNPLTLPLTLTYPTTFNRSAVYNTRVSTRKYDNTLGFVYTKTFAYLLI